MSDEYDLYLSAMQDDYNHRKEVMEPQPEPDPAEDVDIEEELEVLPDE